VSKIFSLIAVAILAVGCAGNTTQTADNAAASKEDAKPEMRCHYERTTSSRLGRKVCERVEE